MRELDWKIHTLMGNDLTGSGWEWLDDESNTIILRLYDLSGEQAGFELQSIPHYSTTWEGAGLVMEWIKNSGDLAFMLTAWTTQRYRASVGECVAFDHSAPLALAKAYISAMEER